MWEFLTESVMLKNIYFKYSLNLKDYWKLNYKCDNSTERWNGFTHEYHQSETSAESLSRNKTTIH